MSNIHWGYKVMANGGKMWYPNSGSLNPSWDAVIEVNTDGEFVITINPRRDQGKYTRLKDAQQSAERLVDTINSLLGD